MTNPGNRDTIFYSGGEKVFAFLGQNLFSQNKVYRESKENCFSQSTQEGTG